MAIRCDRTFLWRRRTVPLAAVARVDPGERAVMLLLDSAGVERADGLQPEEIRPGWVAARIARYAGAGGGTRVAPPPADGNDAVAVAAPTDGSQLAAAAAARPRAQYVLFVPTSAGYLLVEREGEVPTRGSTIELRDPEGSFAVVKLAGSPLPGDERPCVYLDRLT